MRLRALDLAGADLGEVELPGKGAFGKTGIGHILSILGDIVAPDRDGCTFVHSTLERGPGVYRADLATRTVEELIAPDHVLEDRTVEQLSVEGPNGPVSYWIMRKASTPLDGSAPVIVTGYGGFNVPWIPYYSAMAAPWTELGGVWVHCHLRGGGEQDKAFWQAGRMHRKQGTFDDFAAIIGDLHARGCAVPEKTGIWGSSNGGLLIAATVVQHPELIGAAIAEVPVTDLMQIRRDPVTLSICMADYGNPDDSADAPFLHAISPCHHVREGVRYPALLCDAGAHDITCPPWHSRKFAAAIQAASASNRRVLLRVRQGAGHNQMTSELAIERFVEELTFFVDELTAE
jgi:prolyl oligopeptidase